MTISNSEKVCRYIQHLYSDFPYSPSVWTSSTAPPPLLGASLIASPLFYLPHMYYQIRSTHNSLSRSSPFSISNLPSSAEKEDAYHFISYLPIAGQLYELDGLQEYPRNHGPVPVAQAGAEESWLKRAREVVQERIASYPEGTVRSLPAFFFLSNTGFGFRVTTRIDVFPQPLLTRLSVLFFLSSSFLIR